MSKARSLADLISGGATIEASEIADSTITGGKLASDIAITTSGNISTTGDLTVDTNTLYVDSTNNRVGIGTTSPEVGLDFQMINSGEGFRVRRHNASNQYIEMSETDGSRHEIKAVGNKELRIFNEASSNSTTFYTNSTERVRINQSGNVGIGTSSPDNILMVSSDGASASAQPLSIVNPVRYGTNDSVELEFGMGRANDTNNLNFPIIGLQKEQQWQGASTNVDASVIFKSVSNQTASEAMRIDSSGNVGIGTSSPTEKLEVYGTEASDGIEILLHNVGNDGVDTIPYTAIRSKLSLVRNGGEIRFGRDSTYGSAGTADSNLQFYTALDDVNTERMRITSTGNVGIGTSSPGRQFEISSANPYLSLKSTDTSNGTSQIFFGDTSDDNVGRISYQHGNNAMLFLTSATERMRIDSSGNVGILNSSPTTPLEVNGAVKINEANGTTNGVLIIDSLVNGNPQIRFYQNGSVKAYLNYLDASDTLALSDIGGNGLHFSPSTQRVGIGRSTPNAKLHVDDSGGGNVFITRTSTNEGIYFEADGTNGTVRSTSPTGSLLFQTNGNNERMRIDSVGRVLAGTTTNVNNAHTFKAIADSNLYFALAAEDATTTVGSIRGILSYATGSSGGAGTGYLFVGRTNTGDKFYVRSDGDCQNTNNSYGAISDRNLKENEVDASSQWNDIKSIQVKNYNLKSLPDKTHLGVIAQDLEASGMNGLVKTDEDGTKSVKYSILYMKSVKALQEAMERIETLEAKVQTLENNQP